VVEVNLVAPLLVARAAVRRLGRSHGGRGGVLVNISSGAATIGSPGEYVHYAAAKAGLDTLTLGLGKEAGPDGVRVVGVAPGAIRTRMHADSGDADRLERIGGAVPLGRPGEPDEIAATVAWLMSAEASYVTATGRCWFVEVCSRTTASHAEFRPGSARSPAYLDEPARGGAATPAHAPAPCAPLACSA